MTRKIFRSTVIVALAVLVASFAIIMTSLYQYYTDRQQEQLNAQLDLASRGVEIGGASYIESLEPSDFRFTLIKSDGKVLADTKADPSKMADHSDREEVKEAISDGYGSSSRYSETLTEKTDYMAKRLDNGDIIRVSATQVTFLTLLLGMLQPLCIVIAIALILSVVLARRLASNVVKPLNDLSFDNPLENESYEELAPILRYMDRQNRQISRQIFELKQKNSEFAAITGNMSEGLVLLNVKGRIISINNAAEKFFDTDNSCVGKDFLTVERNPKITGLIESLIDKEEAETDVSKDGRDYLLRFSRIKEDDDIVGVMLLIMDVTEKRQGEKTRREFTANVSHQLKTPLQSIIGSAELLENGLVKEEDVPRFVGHIRDDAAYLVTLVNDIIRLSQLDEKTDIPFEEVDLYSTAEDAISSLSQLAEENSVEIMLEGEKTLISGVRQLAYEIIYNLVENGIKYNREQGRVTCHIGREENKAFIRVTDTGIGIEKEHYERIFERFYRADKSHSRSTGGTGLGLSIVKHAVQFMNGNIRLSSIPGEGTTILVELPLLFD